MSASIMTAIGDGNAPTWCGHGKATYQGHEDLGQVTSFVVITESKMYWERYDGPPIDPARSPADQGVFVHTLDFHDAVHLYQDDTMAIHILSQPFDVSNDRFAHAPSQTVDDCFLLYDNAAGVALQNAMRYSRNAMAKRHGIVLLAALNRIPVATWAICPLCGGRILQTTEHAAACSVNRHYFSDSNTKPVVSFERDDYGALIGDEPFESFDDLYSREGVSWGDRTLAFHLDGDATTPKFLLSLDEPTMLEAAKVKGSEPL